MPLDAGWERGSWRAWRGKLADRWSDRQADTGEHTGAERGRNGWEERERPTPAHGGPGRGSWRGCTEQGCSLRCKRGYTMVDIGECTGKRGMMQWEGNGEGDSRREDRSYLLLLLHRLAHWLAASLTLVVALSLRLDWRTGLDTLRLAGTAGLVTGDLRRERIRERRGGRDVQEKSR